MRDPVTWAVVSVKVVVVVVASGVALVS